MSSRRETSRAEPAFDISEHLPPLSGETVFGNSKPLALDIGCGEGEFLFELSQLIPEFNHIGIEVKPARFKKAVKTARQRDIGNVKLIHMDGLMAVELFAPQTFDRVYINFPDPWPKDRHRKHRIINGGFVSLLGSVIRPGGVLEIASDHDEYMARVEKTFGNRREFQNAGGSSALRYPGERPQSRFEKIFRKRGESIKYLSYRATGKHSRARKLTKEPGGNMLSG